MNAQQRLFATGGSLLAALIGIGLFAASEQVQAESAANPASANGAVVSKATLRDQLRALLREEPEIVMEAIDLYQLREEQQRQQQIAQALPKFIPQIETLISQGERVLVQGGEDADVTMIEFADYNCPVCRRVQPEIKAFLEADPKVRHVVKALAYIGSPYPEMAIVAAAEQGDQAKVTAFHRAMMGYEGRLNEEKVHELAAKVGLDPKKIAEDVRKESVTQRVQRTVGIARALDIRGTPALLFPDRITSFVTTSELTAIAQDVRSSR